MIRRVHISFAGTVYQLSRCQYGTFGVILAFYLLSGIALPIVSVIGDKLHPSLQNASVLVLILYLILYPITTTFAACIFQRKLLALTKMQAGSSANLSKMLELNHRQQMMIGVAAYVLYTIRLQMSPSITFEFTVSLLCNTFMTGNVFCSSPLLYARH